MALLFQISGQVVSPNPETLLISPFKEIWERDKSKDKDVAIAEFCYIEFMTSVMESNPFAQYDATRKEAVIIEQVIFMKDWKPDEQVRKCMERIEEFKVEASDTYLYYMSAKTAAEKMRHFFLNVDVNERDLKTGKPIWKPKDITSALNDTQNTLSTLKGLEKKVLEEIYDTIKTRADKEISIFANPESLL